MREEEHETKTRTKLINMTRYNESRDATLPPLTLALFHVSATGFRMKFARRELCVVGYTRQVTGACRKLQSKLLYSKLSDIHTGDLSCRV